MTWKVLDKPKTDTIINAVKSAGLGSLFAPDTTEARMRDLPFYAATKLYRLTNYATLPAFSLFYLGDDENFTYLNGDFDGIAFYNTAENLILNKDTILPYLDFYFIFVALDVGEINILGERDNYQILEEFPEDAEVSYDDAYGVFTINVPLYFDGAIMNATIEITNAGNVSITDTRMSIKSIQEQGDTDNANEY